MPVKLNDNLISNSEFVQDEYNNNLNLCSLGSFTDSVSSEWYHDKKLLDYIPNVDYLCVSYNLTLNSGSISGKEATIGYGNNGYSNDISGASISISTGYNLIVVPITGAMVGKQLWIRPVRGQNTTANYTLSNIMVNEGQTALPYQPYVFGGIIHMRDIEPTLLWKNDYPNDSFDAQQVSLTQSLSNFKYFIIEYKIEQSSQQVPQFQKFRYQGVNCYLGVIDTSSGKVYHRMFSLNNNSFTVGYVSGSSNNVACIPLAIYGTNIL